MTKPKTRLEETYRTKFYSRRTGAAAVIVFVRAKDFDEAFDKAEQEVRERNIRWI